MADAKTDNIPTAENLDPLQYRGIWYEIARTKSITVERGDENFMFLNVTGENKFNVAYFDVKSSGELMDCKATLKPDGSGVTGRFTQEYKDKMPESPANHIVLKTDHKNYTLTYSDKTVEGKPVKYAWIASRTETMDEDSLKAALDAMEKLVGLKREDFAIYNQSGQKGQNKK